jgi:hypothetical protein
VIPQYCANGHAVRPGTAFCPMCGLPMVQAPPPTLGATGGGQRQWGRTLMLAGVATLLVAGAAITAVVTLSGGKSKPAAVTSTTTSVATTTTVAPSPVPSDTTTTAPAAVPVLGQPWASSQQGYGQSRPTEISNGGDPTGIVTGITWQSWGGPKATGTGTGSYDPPNQPVSNSIQTTATVVAFDLGTCQGKLMYRAVEWYFPGEGQTFDPGAYLNDCTGQYVAPTAGVPAVSPGVVVPAGALTALTTYFESIDSGQYQAAYDVLAPSEQATISEAKFAADDSTTQDTAVTVTAAQSSGTGTETVTVGFTSHQAAQDGPNGDTCDVWDLNYSLEQVNGAWRITGTSQAGAKPYTSC